MSNPLTSGRLQSANATAGRETAPTADKPVAPHATRKERDRTICMSNNTWKWIQDTPTQGRAMCQALGISLLLVWDDEGIVYGHWRVRGDVCHDFLHQVGSC